MFPVRGIRKSSTAAVAELKEDSTETTADEFREHVERPILPDNPDLESSVSNGGITRKIGKAFAASQTVPLISEGMLLSSKKTGQELQAFLESNHPIAIVHWNRLHYNLLVKLNKKFELGLRVLRMDRKHKPEYIFNALP